MEKNTLHHLWEIYAALFGYIYQWKIPPNNVAQNCRLASGGWESRGSRDLNARLGVQGGGWFPRA